MQYDIQPKYDAVKVTCSCGHSFQVRSTAGHDLQVEICSKCHPFFTGTQKMVDTAGRVERFRAKYARKKSSKSDDK